MSYRSGEYKLLVVAIVLIVLVIDINALATWWTNAIAGKNCSYILNPHTQHTNTTPQDNYHQTDTKPSEFSKIYNKITRENLSKFHASGKHQDYQLHTIRSSPDEYQDYHKSNTPPNEPRAQEPRFNTSITSLRQTTTHSDTHEDDDDDLRKYLQNLQFRCPPWYVYNIHNDSCYRGSTLNSRLSFNDRTGQTWLEPFYCMTTTLNNSTGNRTDVVGGCYFSTAVNRRNTYYPLPCNASVLNEYMCANLNRNEQLCGQCKEGFGPPVYSYFLKCFPCSNSTRNWIKYTAIAFGPLTVFSVLVTALHISPTSPFLHGFIFYCHSVSLPPITRLVVVSNGFESAGTAMRGYMGFMAIWNLDFFRLVYDPFCVHPNITIVQSLALDYLIAVYPLVLICITYLLVTLHSRNYRIVVFVWKPFRRILRSFLHNLDVRTSLIESFATLYLLSTIKFQSVSLDLLTPTFLHYTNGTLNTKLYLFLAGNIEYFGPHHRLFGILAIFCLIIVIIAPTLLLFLYPCRCFQRCLNHFKCNSHTLRTFMDVFQGHYKDGTENTRDMRYFSGVYFTARTLFMLIFALLNSYEALITITVFLTVLTVMVTMMNPQKTKFHYVVDCIFLLALTLLFVSGAGYVMVPYNSNLVAVAMVLIIGSMYLPAFYVIGLFVYWVCWRKRIPQRMVATVLAVLRVRG